MFSFLSILASSAFVVYINPTTISGILFLFLVTWMGLVMARAMVRATRRIARVVTALQA